MGLQNIMKFRTELKNAKNIKPAVIINCEFCESGVKVEKIVFTSKMPGRDTQFCKGCQECAASPMLLSKLPWPKHVVLDKV